MFHTLNVKFIVSYSSIIQLTTTMAQRLVSFDRRANSRKVIDVFPVYRTRHNSLALSTKIAISQRKPRTMQGKPNLMVAFRRSLIVTGIVSAESRAHLRVITLLGRGILDIVILYKYIGYTKTNLKIFQPITPRSATAARYFR